MKILTYIGIGCMLLIVISVIYTQWETKNFVESLSRYPESPNASEETQQNPSVIKLDNVEETQQMLSEDTNPGLSVKNRSPSQPKALSPEMKKKQVPIEDSRKMQYSDWQNDDAHLHEHSGEKNPWKSGAERQVLNAKGPNITVEELRSQLVERFGDIPQVHTYVNIRDEILKGTTLTLNEYIMYTESMNYLFPSQKTEQSIEALKKVRLTINGP